jgi:hypothetical protein
MTQTISRKVVTSIGVVGDYQTLAFEIDEPRGAAAVTGPVPTWAAGNNTGSHRWAELRIFRTTDAKAMPQKQPISAPTTFPTPRDILSPPLKGSAAGDEANCILAGFSKEVGR